MDVNVTLLRMLELATRITHSAGPAKDDVADAEELAELTLALDAWRTKGGFLPARWTLCGHCGAKPIAYAGAVYCGAGCTARAGA